ncbi:MAG: hypothetical protein K1X92_17030 [Bacteroidia bacterium]|nr:hypothetical protein [Bacteroidia bacterium]
MAFIFSQEIKDKISDIILSVNPEVFIVEIAIKRQKKAILLIRIDTDNGIKIDECITISRAVGKWLDENEPFDFEYNLEVTSPGIGEPLLLKRQYLKEIGRKVRVISKKGEVWEGKLSEVMDTEIQLELELPKKKKKGEPEPETHKVISLSVVKEAIVIV